MNVRTTFNLALIRNFLNLNGEPWLNLPNDLLYLSLIPEGFIVNVPEIIEKYNFRNNGMLEFLGDAVFDVVVAQYLVNYNLDSYPLFAAHFVSNSVLTCLLHRTYVCDIEFPVTGKDCADRFEAIIGTLFYYRKDIQLEKNALDAVSEWFYYTFNMTELFNQVNQTGNNIYSGSVVAYPQRNAQPITMNMTIEVTLPENFRIKMESVKKILGDVDIEFLDEMPLDFLLLAFMDMWIPDPIKNTYVSKYGLMDRSRFKYLGKALYKLLVAYDIIHLAQLNILKSMRYEDVTKVHSADHFIRVIKEKSLDTHTLSGHAHPNLIYSLFGVLYYYLYNIQGYPNAFDIFQNWFIHFWPADLRAYNVLQR